LDGLLNEIQILSELRSEYVLRYFWCWAEAQDILGDVQLSREMLQRYIRRNLPTESSTTDPISHIFIQTELCHLSLSEYLTNVNAAADGNFERQNVLRIAQDITCGLKHVHSMGYIHRDIKPGNILGRRDDQGVYTWKIADFGKAVRKENGPEGNTGRAGTETYRSYEMVLGHRYSTKTDVYSLGLVFVELVQQHGSLFHKGKCFDKIRILVDDDARLGFLCDEPTLNTHVNFVRVINQMLRTNPDNRPSSFELDPMISFLPV
jgi:serine/threonine protein kinase